MVERGFIRLGGGSGPFGGDPCSSLPTFLQSSPACHGTKRTAAGVTNMSTAVYINADDRSNGNVMDEDGEGEVRGATANPPTVDLGILNLDDEDLTLV